MKNEKNSYQIKILQRGAEAIIYLESENIVVKDRIKKSYRIREIDEKLRRIRTKKEAKLLRVARELGVKTPKVISAEEYKIKMEFIYGKKLKDVLQNLSKEKIEEIFKIIANYIALLHSKDIIHGDLTTSNFILKDDEIYLIDFGLGFYSSRIEDKATDLYLLYQSIKSAHFNILNEAWNIILKKYRENYEKAELVIKRLEEIKRRGRYRGR
ncbi:MAG: KEOPS complex kinase/ATPase Bud32 [Candidatus Aenigmatarchaeota archaeon]|nr:Kae1-associated serine/threonine protein kinase [Candidatus Aenigmarchaeota archaeon]